MTCSPAIGAVVPRAIDSDDLAVGSPFGSGREPIRQVVRTDADADPRRDLPSDHCAIAVDLFRLSDPRRDGPSFQ